MFFYSTSLREMQGRWLVLGQLLLHVVHIQCPLSTCPQAWVWGPLDQIDLTSDSLLGTHGNLKQATFHSGLFNMISSFLPLFFLPKTSCNERGKAASQNSMVTSSHRRHWGEPPGVYLSEGCRQSLEPPIRMDSSLTCNTPALWQSSP